MRSPFSFLITLFVFLLAGESAFSKPIKVTNVSALDFGLGGPGDPAKIVAPGTSETSTNGSFQVTGDANTAYTITLPVSATISKGNPNNDTIVLSAFQSFPPAGANGLLSPAGSQNLFVGATRAALKINQIAGTYTGNYSVTVVY